MESPQSFEDLVSEYIKRMNAHGKDSPEANSFYAKHSVNAQFADHATGLNRLKKAFDDYNKGWEPPPAPPEPTETPVCPDPKPPDRPVAAALQQPS
jgi:hypothetical protein